MSVRPCLCTRHTCENAARNLKTLETFKFMVEFLTPIMKMGMTRFQAASEYLKKVKFWRQCRKLRKVLKSNSNMSVDMNINRQPPSHQDQTLRTSELVLLEYIYIQIKV